MSRRDTIQRLISGKQRTTGGMLKLSSYYFLPGFIPLKAFDIAFKGQDSWTGIKKLLGELKPDPSLPAAIYNQVDRRFKAWARFVNRQIHKAIADKSDPFVAEALRLYQMNPAMNRGPIIFGLMMRRYDWFKHVVLYTICGENIGSGENSFSFDQIATELLEDTTDLAELLGFHEELYWSGLAIWLLREAVCPEFEPPIDRPCNPDRDVRPNLVSCESLNLSNRPRMASKCKTEVLYWLYHALAVQPDDVAILNEYDFTERFLTGLEVLSVFFVISDKDKISLKSHLIEADGCF